MTISKTEPNLLVKLQRWARLKRQDENFTTGAFAHLLEYLFRHESDSGLELFEVLTGFKNPSWLCSVKCKGIEVDTQHQTDHGIPDIKISGEDFCVFVEVKVEANVDTNQLNRYQKALRQEDWAYKSRRRLVLLTKYKPSKKVPSGIKKILWFDIAERLGQIKKRCRSLYGKFLIEQFVGFIDRPKFFIERERSPLSKELNAYMKRKGDKSIFEDSFTEDDIKRESKLAQLNVTLRLMREVIDSVEDWRKRTFGMSAKTGWVGYGLNDHLYWIYLWIEDPETIFVIRQREDTTMGKRQYGLDTEKWDGSRGAIEPDYHWRDWLDLNDTDYFEVPRDKCFKILKGFFTKSLKYADRTWGRGR